MPTRPTSASKKAGGKKSSSPPGKKGKKKSGKDGALDPHQEQIEGLIREREELRAKFNVICSKLMENVNMDDYQHEIDLTKQQPSDCSVENLLSMIDQICNYRIAFLNLFQETDDNQRIPIQKKITQLSIDQPDMFRRRLKPEQRLTFITRERDLWKENAQLLQIMYATIVDQLENGAFQKAGVRVTDILTTHRLNLEDVCLIFSSPNIRSIHDAQKLRAKKTLDNELNELRGQHAFFDLEQSQEQQDLTGSSLSNVSSTIHYPPPPPSTIGGSRKGSFQSGTIEHRGHLSSNTKRSVSFADEVDVLNHYDESDSHPVGNRQSPRSYDQLSEENAFSNSSSLIEPNNDQLEKLTDSDYYSLSSTSSYQQQHPHYQSSSQPVKSVIPSKYRLPPANETVINKMDSNLRMLIIKELSKNGQMERPLSRMSSAYGNTVDSANSQRQRRHRSRRSSSDVTPEWVELARLIGIDQSEIDHWLSQNLQYPAGRVISAWCNYASPPPTVAELHSLVSSNELNRPDLARYIETMYII